MSDVELLVVLAPHGSRLHDHDYTASALPVAHVHHADDLHRRLDSDYASILVLVDLAAANTALLDRLQGDDAPRSIMLFAGDTLVERIELAPQVRAYLDADADVAAIDAAIEAALIRPVGSVGDFSDRDSARLNALGRDVERIARALSELASEATPPPVVTITAAYVRTLLKGRRDRARYFPAELFSDPAWDMLLDLTAARIEYRSVSVSSLCIAAAVPTTTALRWIRNLCDVGMFERNTDPDDLRRGIITLSERTAERMLTYLATLRGAASPA